MISLLGGVALFLFGMTLMGDGLKKVAGNKLEITLLIPKTLHAPSVIFLRLPLTIAESGAKINAGIALACDEI